MKKTFTSALLLLLVAAPFFAQPADTFEVGSFIFATPDGWKKVSSLSPMRKAQLEVGEGTAKAEVTFFHFGGGSGTAADNVSRWFGQFSGGEANRKSESTEVNGVKITFVETAGTFSSGMPGGPTTPMPGYALRGAILENAAAGDVYVKMTGPEAVVKSSTAAFNRLVTEAAQPATR